MIFNYLNGDTTWSFFIKPTWMGTGISIIVKFLKMGQLHRFACINSWRMREFQYDSNSGIVWEQDGAIMFKNSITRCLSKSCNKPLRWLRECHHPVLSSSYWWMGEVYRYGYYDWFQFINIQVLPGLLLHSLLPGLTKILSCAMGSSFLAWQAREGSNWRLKFADVYRTDVLFSQWFSWC